MVVLSHLRSSVFATGHELKNDTAEIMMRQLTDSSSLGNVVEQEATSVLVDAGNRKGHFDVHSVCDKSSKREASFSLTLASSKTWAYNHGVPNNLVKSIKAAIITNPRDARQNYDRCCLHRVSLQDSGQEL